MRYSHATRWFITLGAAGALLLGACTDNGDGGAADTDSTTTATATATATEATGAGGTATAAATGVPTEIATAEVSPTADPNAPTGAQPPALEASSDGESVAAGLGSYCWTTPGSGGQPGLCADAIGIITTSGALAASIGAEVVLEPTEEDVLASATAVNVQVWPRDELGDPITSGDWGVAWNPGAAPATVIEGTLADGTVTFTAPDEAGAYIVGLFVTFENGDAMYGLQLEVE